MSVAGETGRADQMREKARHMTEAAERTNDPEQRRRLQEKARKLQEQSERPAGRGGSDSPCSTASRVPPVDCHSSMSG
ncbi:DUF6381 family protein [Streptomyces sp. AC154]|uniref:DUF6381 family protein n=1 Tax=Streptomyces sp. AC154 TaxID=3143184 RepID=UPI003F7E27A8